jgi:hypothetical protein
MAAAAAPSPASDRKPRRRRWCTDFAGGSALFLFFSNRMGCGTSLLITLGGSLLLLWLMGWLRF